MSTARPALLGARCAACADMYRLESPSVAILCSAVLSLPSRRGPSFRDPLGRMGAAVGGRAPSPATVCARHPGEPGGPRTPVIEPGGAVHLYSIDSEETPRRPAGASGRRWVSEHFAPLALCVCVTLRQEAAVRTRRAHVPPNFVAPAATAHIAQKASASLRVPCVGVEAGTARALEDERCEEQALVLQPLSARGVPPASAQLSPAARPSLITQAGGALDRGSCRDPRKLF